MVWVIKSNSFKRVGSDVTYEGALQNSDCVHCQLTLRCAANLTMTRFPCREGRSVDDGVPPAYETGSMTSLRRNAINPDDECQLPDTKRHKKTSVGEVLRVF